MYSSFYIQIRSLRISFKSVRKLCKNITLLFDGVMDIEWTYVIVSDVILMKLIKCRYKIPTEFLELSNIPFAIIFPSVSNNIWKICIQILKDKEVCIRKLLLKTTVDTKRIVHLDKVWTLSRIENFINMFFVEDIFIKLTLYLFEFSLCKSYGVVVIPASIKSLVKVERVEKHIVDLHVECLLIHC